MSYQKQNFANGEVLTAPQLNYIENGIVDLESAVNENKGVVDNIIDPTLSLSGKAADAKATGDAVGQLKEDIGDINKTFVVSANLLDYKKVKKSEQNSNYYSDYIPVKSGVHYYTSKNGVSFLLVNIHVYDENKESVTDIPYVADINITQDGFVILESNSDIRMPGYQFQANGITSYVPYSKRNVLSTTISDYITPEMFGAFGDGTSDDSDAIQQAVNYSSQNGLPLYFRKKTYKISKSIELKNNTYIDGNMASIYDDGYFTAFIGSDIIVHIRNLKFSGAGNKTMTDNNAIRVSCYYSSFENIKITGFYCGINLSGADVNHSLVENSFMDITIFKCCRGIKLGDNDGNARGTDGFLENVVVWCDDSEYAVQLNTGSGWRVSNIHVYGSVDVAIWFINAYALDVSNIYIEQYKNVGIFVNNQGIVNMCNIEVFSDGKDSSVLALEKSGWTITNDVYLNLANIHVWIRSGGGKFISGSNVYVLLANYTKSGNTGNFTENAMNNKEYVKIASYSTLN